MDLTSTPFVKYHEINVEDTDIYDDAWGFNTEFSDVIACLGRTDCSPALKMSERLIDMISSMGKC